jgi:hypothetical protein
VTLLAVAALWLVPKMTPDTNPAAGASAFESSPSVPLSPVPAVAAPPEPAPPDPISPDPVSPKRASSTRIASGDEVPAAPGDSGGQAKPKQRAARPPPAAKPVPKAQPAPTQPNVQIIDESTEAKVKVDVID